MKQLQGNNEQGSADVQEKSGKAVLTPRHSGEVTQGSRGNCIPVPTYQTVQEPLRVRYSLY